MFTGLVEECGTVVECLVQEHTARLTVRAPLVHVGVQIGDSVAINGCCLTVVDVEGDQLSFDAVPETMARTNLGDMKSGDPINLERPLAAGARLGGHFVQGHIDGVGTVLSVQPDENALIVEISVPEPLRRYIVEKGSIAVDGVSLTVARVYPESFSVWIIPHTQEVTRFGQYKVGDRVNLECDILGKYVERLLAERAL
jgi:riboflavin synthase